MRLSRDEKYIKDNINEPQVWGEVTFWFFIMLSCKDEVISSFQMVTVLNPPIPLSGPQETDLEGTASQCLLLHPGLQGGLHDNDEGDEGTKTLPASLTEPVTMG